MQPGTPCITDTCLAEALWPGARIAAGRSSGGIDYLAGPSVADPRFLLPADRRRADAVLREFRNGGNAAARRRSAAVRAAVAVTGGWPALHALSVEPEPGVPTIEDWTSTVLGRSTSIGIQLGPRRANRKPILQVLGDDGRPIAVGKVGTTPLTRHLVEAEADALELLDQVQLPGVWVPAPLHRGAFGPSAVVMMSHLPLRDARATVDEERRTAAMVTVARSHGTRTTLPADSGIVGRLHAAAVTITEPDIRAACLRCLDLVAGRPEPWELGCWHGDWTNWNMAALGDEVLLWDWERFDTDVPVGWDALHYALRGAIESQGPVLDVARTLVLGADRTLAPFGVTPRMAPYVAATYLVALTVRYTLDGQRAAGGRSAKVEEWVLPVLDSLWERTLW
jgi:hypothetical protein